MHYYIDVIKKYIVFGGRATRKEYWMFFLFHFIIVLILTSLSFNEVFKVLNLIYDIFIFIPAMSVLVRRYHDINLSGVFPVIFSIIINIFLILHLGSLFDNIYFLIGLPMVIVTFLFAVQRGTIGTNKYGPEPLTDDYKIGNKSRESKKLSVCKINANIYNDDFLKYMMDKENLKDYLWAIYRFGLYKELNIDNQEKYLSIREIVNTKVHQMVIYYAVAINDKRELNKNNIKEIIKIFSENIELYKEIFIKITGNNNFGKKTIGGKNVKKEKKDKIEINYWVCSSCHCVNEKTLLKCDRCGKDLNI
jgi:uncharacterized membrane protein YhaH (DUF805 family)